jgi:ribonucleoside-diphosphate reductase alpha chain
LTVTKIETKKSVTPEYFTLNNQLNIIKDGKIQLNADREAVHSYFIDYVNPHTVYFGDLREKLDYLVKHKYIKGEVLDKYTFKFIKKLFKTLYNKKFRFTTFMGAYKFYTQYAMRTTDGKSILERYEDRIAFNALVMGDGDEQLALDIANEMISQTYQPATPTFSNAGKLRGGNAVSCFLLNIEDNMTSIGRSVNSVLQLSKMGGGVGINLTDIRPSGDPIKGIENMADGVVPIMKLYEDSFSYANQLGTRNGAGVTYLNVFHKDIVKFLSTKKENADEKVRVKTLSLGVVVPDKFYELIAKGESMYLFSPYDIYNEYGKLMSEINITEMYDELVENKNIKKDKIFARDLEEEMSKLIQESGYPYIINIDTANQENAVDGVIKMSNLCSEILQVQSPSELNPDQTYKTVGTDVSCNLGSTNIAHLMESPDFGKSVRTAFRALTYIADSSNIEEVPTVKNANDKYHSVGLGAMGLHGFLAKNGILYGSPESIEFTGMYFQLLNYWTLFESNQIAIERNQAFYNFDKSEYANGKYFKRYLPRVKFKNNLSDTVQELFKDIDIPTAQAWADLQASIEEHGLYNSYRLAVAPTGSISYINEATASIHPIVQKIEKRSEGKRGDVFYPAPYLAEGLPYYESAYNIDQRRVIDIYAEAQKHVDQALSMTLFMSADHGKDLYEWKVGSKGEDSFTTRDINILRNYAWSKGIKSIYYVRTYRSDGEVSSVNECESCSI